MDDLKRILLGYDGDIAYALRRLKKLEKLAAAANSCLSEPDMKKHVSCYVRGVELLELLEELERG